MSVQMTQFCSFLWLSNIPLFIGTTSSLSIHLLVDIWVAYFKYVWHPTSVFNTLIFLSINAELIWKNSLMFMQICCSKLPWKSSQMNLGRV